MEILSNIKEKTVDNKYTSKRLETIQKTMIYFSNQAISMNYAAQIEQDLSIGSGVTEAVLKRLLNLNKSVESRFLAQATDSTALQKNARLTYG